MILRENLEFSASKFEALIPYASIGIVSAAIVFTVGRSNRTFWRYVSLVDVMHTMAVVTIALLAALLATFVLNRLDGVARSLPVIQWFVLIALMTGSRIIVRLFFNKVRSQERKLTDIPDTREHILVVGVSDVTNLYLRAITEFAPDRFDVVGLLTQEPLLQRGSMRALKVLGKPQDAHEVINELDVHGVTVDRIVITQPFDCFPKEAQEALRTVESSSAIKIDWLIEKLGFDSPRIRTKGRPIEVPTGTKKAAFSSTGRKNEDVKVGRYHRLKRLIDGVAATCLIIALAPVIAITSLLVAVDVGFPLVFWQQRPGRNGYAFKIFKFRTMSAAHSENGNRVPDELRSSLIGRFLRAIWLDELPQLYNIMIGEMSFVGPRPLLSVDQPMGQSSRLAVRPGLTGWAQVNGGRDLSSEEKAAFDIWYIKNASLWLDLEIIFATIKILASGGQLNASPHPEEDTKTSERSELYPQLGHRSPR